MNSHHLITTGGGYRCNRCGVAWDIGEDMSGECRPVNLPVFQQPSKDDEYPFNAFQEQHDVELAPRVEDAGEPGVWNVTAMVPNTPEMRSYMDAIDAYHGRRPAGTILRFTPMRYPPAEQVGGRHYKGLVIQPTEFCMRNGLDFCIGSILKYVTRHRAKNGAEDLRKARHFVEIREAFPLDIRPPHYIAITMLEYVTRNNIRPDDAEALYRLEAYYNATDINIRAAAQRVITEIDKLVETTY